MHNKENGLTLPIYKPKLIFNMHMITYHNQFAYLTLKELKPLTSLLHDFGSKPSTQNLQFHLYEP